MPDKQGLALTPTAAPDADYGGETVSRANLSAEFLNLPILVRGSLRLGSSCNV